MNQRQLLESVILIVLILILSGCAGLDMPTWPAPPTFPSPNSGQRAISPLAGNWTTVTPFGEAVFAIDATGSKVLAAKVDLHDWTCGANTLTESLQETSDSWTVQGGKLSVEFDLKTGHVLQLTFNGRYDGAHKKFSGIWEGDFYGTRCSGTWETSKHE